MLIRKVRVEERIHFILSTLLQREIADPRLLDLTITKVTMDPELRFAKVYVNALGDEERQEEIMTTLARASGYFRNAISQRIRLKHIPKIQFHWDSSLQESARIHELLEIIKSDSE